MTALQKTSANLPAWLDRSAYPFATRRLTLAGGGQLNYVDEGAGPIVLFVHGTPTWSFEWRHLIRALSRTHRCIAPDHLGFGLSDRPREASYAPESHAARLGELVEQLDLSDITLVVHDFGGVIGLPLAVEERSRVSRIVVINSWMWDLGDDPGVRRMGRLFGGSLGRFLYERLNFSLRVITPAAFADRKRLTRGDSCAVPRPVRRLPEPRARALAARTVAGSPFPACGATLGAPRRTREHSGTHRLGHPRPRAQAA